MVSIARRAALVPLFRVPHIDFVCWFVFVCVCVWSVGHYMGYIVVFLQFIFGGCARAVAAAVQKAKPRIYKNNPETQCVSVSLAKTEEKSKSNNAMPPIM